MHSPSGSTDQARVQVTDMTFCGKPSQNCLRCRTRRIRCDRLQSGCSQCKRAHEECSGYRDEASLMFRNENERIIRRSKAAHERSRVQQAEKRSDATKQSKQLTLRSTAQGQIERPLPMVPGDLDAYGLAFFFKNFSNRPWDEGSFSFGRSQTMFRDLDIDQSFRNAVSSVGLAALSNVKRDRALLGLARQTYGGSLNAVRVMVENPWSIEVGPLLKLIVMLAIFEMVDARPNAVKSWGVHLSGIAALLKRIPFPKGPEFDVQAQLWYYLAVVVHFFQVGGPFPTTLDHWPKKRMELFKGENKPHFELIDKLVSFVRFCSVIHLYKTTEEVLHQALGFEMEFGAWMEHLPEQWSFTVHESETDTAGTFYRQYHIYGDAWAARVLNHYQLARLLVNEMIVVSVSQLDKPSAGWTEQKQRSLAVISEMATDICTGVATQGFFAEPGNMSFGGTPRPLMKGVFMTIYPMTVAASATGVSDRTRNWVIERLQTMGDRTGIRQALEAIARIENSVANQAMGKPPLHLSELLPK